MKKPIDNKSNENKFMLYKQVKKPKPVMLNTEDASQIINIKEINYTLIQMGYSIEQMFYLFSNYQYTNLEVALDLLNKNGSFYNHEFYNESQNNSLPCVLCNEMVDVHLNYEYNSSKKNKLGIRISNFENIKFNQYDSNRQTLASIQQISKKNFVSKESACVICFADIGDYVHLDCTLSCCKMCLRFHVVNELKHKNIMEIPCPCCNFILSSVLVKEYVDQTSNITRNSQNVKKTFVSGFLCHDLIPCVFPNCNIKIVFNDLSSKFVECKGSHKFCAICKHSWHPNKKCNFKKLNDILKSSEIFRLCVNCGVFVKRKEDSKTLECQNCFFKFCYFCNKRIDEDHFSKYKLRQCAWMSKETKTVSVIDSCNMLTLYLFRLIFKLLVFLIVGAPINFILLYYEYRLFKALKLNKKIEDMSSLSQIGPGISNTVSATKSTLFVNKKPETSFLVYFNYIIIVIFGILIQPVYVIYKGFDLILEKYKFMGVISIESD